VINKWLVEMGVGHMPTIGGLYDQTLKDESAEAIYDRIVCDLRRYHKITTMREPLLIIIDSLCIIFALLTQFAAALPLKSNKEAGTKLFIELKLLKLGRYS
jgi:hypothetical protein